MKVYDDTGAELDATFAVTRMPTGCVLTFESGGPSGRASVGRNTQYNIGLELLITRLGVLGATLEDALLASRTTRDLPEDERRVDLAGGYPVTLSAVDASAFRAELGSTLADMARRPGALGGGNRQKRLELVLTLPTYAGSESDLELALALGGVSDPLAAVAAPRTRAAVQKARQRRVEYLRAVERHAVATAIRWYDEQGYTVKNVGATEAWDLETSRGSELRRVEVKGSAGPRDAVGLTMGEVLNAGEWSPVDLFVVDNIERSEEGGVIRTSGGRVRRWPDWRPATESLQPLTYSHVLPPSPQRPRVVVEMDHPELTRDHDG
jgi:hypothetical protein